MEKINIIITRKDLTENTLLEKDILELKKSYLNIGLLQLPVISTHSIESEAVYNTIKKIEEGFYHYCIFLSSAAVEIFFDKIFKHDNGMKLLTELKKMRIVAIGPYTKKTIEKYGFKTFLTNDKKDYSSKDIVLYLENLDKSFIQGSTKIKVLIPRSSESIKSNNLIEENFNNILIEQIFFYEIKTYRDLKGSTAWNSFVQSVKNKDNNFLIFTSPSNVRSFFTITKKLFPNVSSCLVDSSFIKYLNIRLIISIGPKTSAEIQKNNIEYIESKEHTIDGAFKLLITKLKNYIIDQ